MALARNINDDITMSYLLKKQEKSADGYADEAAEHAKDEAISEAQSLVESAKTVVISIELDYTAWSGQDTFSQDVTVQDGTENSLVELQPTPEQILQLLDDGVTALTIENDGGDFIAHCIGGPTTTDMTIQATRTEVIL